MVKKALLTGVTHSRYRPSGILVEVGMVGEWRTHNWSAGGAL